MQKDRVENVHQIGLLLVFSYACIFVITLYVVVDIVISTQISIFSFDSTVFKSP